MDKNNHSLKFENFQELEDHLRNCAQWNSRDSVPYDLVGITNLLSAILDNLGRNLIDDDIDEIREILTAENLALMDKIKK